MADHLFTYGTLRREAPMHGLLEGRTTWVGLATTAGRLIDLGDFPGLVSADAASDRVSGELYRLVDAQREALLDALDRYEGSRFVRELAPVEGPSGPVTAWLYRWLGDPRGREPVPGGDYLAGLRRPDPRLRRVSR